MSVHSELKKRKLELDRIEREQWRDNQLKIMQESRELDSEWIFDSFRPASGEWLDTMSGKIIRAHYDCGCIETNGKLSPCKKHAAFPCTTWRPLWKNMF